MLLQASQRKQKKKIGREILFLNKTPQHFQDSTVANWGYGWSMSSSLVYYCYSQGGLSFSLIHTQKHLPYLVDESSQRGKYMLEGCFGLPVFKEGKMNVKNFLHQWVVAIIV